MRFEIDWASLIVGSKFTVFALFYFVFEGNLTAGFLRYEFGGLYTIYLGGAYFSEFCGTQYMYMYMYMCQQWSTVTVQYVTSFSRQVFSKTQNVYTRDL